MPNVAAPFGLQPIEQGDGSPYNGKANRYYIPLANASAFYIGDPVISAAGADANGIPQIAKAAAGATIRGVIVGVEVVAPGAPSVAGTTLSLETIAIPATKTRDYYVYVADDPSLIYEMQGDATGTNQTAANSNKNANFTVAAPSAGATSATVIDSGTIAVTQALPLKLMGLSQRQLPGGNAFGASAIWRVRINQHELMGNTAGV